MKIYTTKKDVTSARVIVADDMFLMLGRNQWAMFFAYVVGSLALGLAMVWLGRKLMA